MHELSLAKSLLRQADEIRTQQSEERIAEIKVELGPLSGVEPLLLCSAFEQLIPNTNASSAKLVLEEVPLIAKCMICESRIMVEQFDFRCPQCEGSLKVIQGDGVYIIGMTFCDTDQLDNPS